MKRIPVPLGKTRYRGRHRHHRSQPDRWLASGFVLLGVFLLVQGWLASIPGRGTPLGETVSRADDFALVLLLLAVCVVRWRRGESIRGPFLMPAALFVLSGIVSALLAGHFGTRTVVGAYTSIKAYLVFLAALNIRWDGRRDVYPTALIAAAIPIACLGILDWAFPALRAHLGMPPVVSERLGLAPAQSIFIHPSVFGSFMVIAAAFSLATFAAGFGRRFLALAALFAGTSLLTLRLKPVLAIVVIIAIMGVHFFRRRDRRQLRLLLGLGLATVLIVGVMLGVIRQQVTSYLASSGESAQARNVLYATSVRIASDRVPLGTGFGTFATWGSRLDYSPVYERYGISRVWGLSKKNPRFIMDTFWPAIVGETGVVGLIAYCVMLMGMAAPAIQLWWRGSESPASSALALGAVLVFASALTESSGSPMFFQQPSTYLAVVPLALCWQAAPHDASAADRSAVHMDSPFGAGHGIRPTR